MHDARKLKKAMHACTDLGMPHPPFLLSYYYIKKEKNVVYVVYRNFNREVIQGVFLIFIDYLQFIMVDFPDI